MPLGTDGTRQTQGTRAERENNHAVRRGAIAAAAMLGGVLLLPALPVAQTMGQTMGQVAAPASPGGSLRGRWPLSAASAGRVIQIRARASKLAARQTQIRTGEDRNQRVHLLWQKLRVALGR